jgi:hypothetical protein
MPQRINGIFIPDDDDYVDCTQYVVSDVTQAPTAEIVYSSAGQSDIHVIINQDSLGKNRLIVWNSKTPPPAPAEKQLILASQTMAFRTISRFVEAGLELRKPKPKGEKKAAKKKTKQK